MLFILGVGIALVAVPSGMVGAAAGWIAQGSQCPGMVVVSVHAGFVLSVLADVALMIVRLPVVPGLPAV